MNSIVLLATALFSVFSPGTLSPASENIARTFLYDARIPYMLSVFTPSFSQTTTYLSHRIVLSTKDWKKNKEKDIAAFFDDTPTELNIWLYGEEEKNFRNANRAFEREFPQVNLRFQTFSQPQEYRQALENAFSGGKIPDVIMMSNNWWPTYRRILSPFPNEIFSKEECADFFFDFSCEAFATTTRMYGIPYTIEIPVMITNRSLLKDDRIVSADKPSGNWPDFLQNGTNFDRFFTEEGSFSALQPGTEYDYTVSIFRTLVSQVQEKEGELIQASLTDIIDSVLKSIYDYGTDKNTRYKNNDTIFNRFLNGKIAVLFGNQETYLALKNAFFQRDDVSISESDIEIYALPSISKADNGVYVSETWAFTVPMKAKYTREAFGYLAYLSHEIPMELFVDDAKKIPARRALVTNVLFKNIADSSENPVGTSGTVAFETLFEENISAFFSGEKTAIEVAEILLPYFSE